jgi:hypothetical protein
VAEPTPVAPQQPADGSITLAANPWGTSATWADYNWRRLADTEDRMLIKIILLRIAEAVEASR